MANVDSIVEALAPVVAELGLDLYDVEITGGGRARVVRVLVDRVGGIDLEGIAAATEAISPVPLNRSHRVIGSPRQKCPNQSTADVEQL